MRFQDLDLYQVGNTIQLVGAIYQGQGRSLLCYFPEEDDGSPTEHLDMSSEQWKVFLRQTDLLETEILEKAEDGTLTKAILRKSQRQIETGVQWRVFRRDNYRCRYCGKDDVPLTVDHLVLWEAGGPTIEENLVSACRRCNKTRGNTSYADWLRNPYYLKASRNLTPEVRAANETLLGTLSQIPRQRIVRSR